MDGISSEQRLKANAKGIGNDPEGLVVLLGTFQIDAEDESNRKKWLMSEATEPKVDFQNSLFVFLVYLTLENFRLKLKIIVSVYIETKNFLTFFTTKSVWEGTDIGWSVSYFIITNGHNWSLKMLSEFG